jgi:RNA polymerase sigma-70 factor (ECF subfamily)
MTSRSNAEWLECLRGGTEHEPAALQDLLAALEKAAFFYIRGHLATTPGGVAADEIQALAEDISQEASVLVLAKLSTFRGEARFLTWASSFAVRIARTALQRKAWREISLDRLPDGWSEPAANVISKNGWENPQEALQRQAIWEAIREVVHTDLTERQRDVLNMVIFQELGTEQVEELLGVTASALYKTTHDARKKLKAGLASRGYGTDEILDAFAAKG